MICDEMRAVFEVEYAVVSFEIEVINSVNTFFKNCDIFLAVFFDEILDFSIFIDSFSDEKRECVFLLCAVKKEGIDSEIAD